MNFEELYNAIDEIGRIEMPTLGALVQNQINPNSITVFTLENKIAIINAQNTRFTFKEDLYIIVLDRWNELQPLDLHLRNGQYTDPNFENGDRVKNPYIAAIIAHFQNA